MLAWLIAQLTKGTLPGDHHEKPTRVLWVGDEDSWEQVVGPRLWAADADSDRVEELTHPAGKLYNARDDADHLDRVIRTGGFQTVVFEALLDHMPAVGRGDLSQHVRASLAPTRAVLRRNDLTALATLHTKKGTATSFRELMAGSPQFNALSRSSLLLANHPEDKDRRLVVAGKQNYSRAASTHSFELAEHSFSLNEEQFSVSLAREFRAEDAITIDSLLATNRVLDDLADEVRSALSSTPQRRRDIAAKVGRSDGTLDRALDSLEAAGVAEKAGRGLWRLKPIGVVA
jgi:hypothetical protein